jgi:DNA-binding CsgD family transcriptional regulator
MAFVLGISVAVVRSLRTHRRDMRIVDMLNGGRTVSEIAQVLNTTERDVREARKRIAGTIGPRTAGP